MKFAAAAFLSALVVSAAAAPAPQTVDVAGVPAVLSVGSEVSAAAFTCPSGKSLTYSIKTQQWPGMTLSKAQNYLKNWVSVAPGTTIKSSGNNSPGSTRSWNYNDGSLGAPGANNEQLTAVINPGGGSSNLEQKWSSTTPQSYQNGGLTFSNAWHDLTVQQPNGADVQLQYYINVCASNQNAAYPVLSTILQDALSYWITGCQNS